MLSFPIRPCTVVYNLIIITYYIIIASIFITSHLKIIFAIMIWTICTFICCHFCIAVKIVLSCKTSLIAVFIRLMAVDCYTFSIAIRVQGFITRNISIAASKIKTITVILINASRSEARWFCKWWNLAKILCTMMLCLLRANWNYISWYVWRCYENILVSWQNYEILLNIVVFRYHINLYNISYIIKNFKRTSIRLGHRSFTLLHH